jgi:TonB-linked SusC/RagA family outer membrane protein
MSNRLRVALVLAALVSLPAGAFAQTTTVSGRVTSDADVPLSSVSVSIPTLGVGATTNEEGRYSFTVTGTGAQVLTARRLGYTPRSITITLSGGTVTQDIMLRPAATQLTGIVVTGLGATREKSTLGTAQQQLNNEELNQTRSLNVMDQISGKVAGAQITGSGTQGGSTRIVIRGSNSITGDNTPLWIVDGTPISKANKGGSANSGWDFGSATNDLNPDDIESMTILKGPNAAALYGSRAANGVILIQTKRGRNTGGRARTEISTYYSFERPGILPDYQNKYGQGAGGSFAYVDGAGGSGTDGLDQSWGPKTDGRLICQFDSPGAGTGSCTPTPFVPHPDNVKNFFNTGHTAAVTGSVSAGTERANARLSIGSDNVEGIIPNNYFTKMSALLSGGVQVNEKLTTNASVNYFRNSGRNRPGVGYSGNGASILENFVWFGRQVDTDVLRNNWQKSATLNGGSASREFNWNYNYHNNPFWEQYANPQIDTRDRIMGTISATYKITPWLDGTLRTGSDIYRFKIDQQFDKAKINSPADPSYQGAFWLTNEYNNENNTDILFTANRSLQPKLMVNATAGANRRYETFNFGRTEVAGLSVAGIYNPANAAITPILRQTDSKRAVNSAYGSAAFTWDGWATIEGTARNDWSSTLPEKSSQCSDCTHSYFYPSVNASFVLTDAMPTLRNSYLTFLKLRGSVARVGNDAAPYQLATTFAGIATQFRGKPQFTMSNTVANPTLKPEITTSTEAGAEVGFLNGRINLDATMYAKETRNQIFNVSISPSSGFTSKAINAGKITNNGFELGLTAIPVQLRNGFQWSSTFNYGANKSKVKELYVNPGTGDTVRTIVLGGTWYVTTEARLGEPYGALVGNSFQRDSATGQLMISSLGRTRVGPLKTLGNIQPDWVGGWSNTLQYKNWTLGGLLDIKKGGDIYSVTNFFGDYAGVLESSLKGREVDFDDPGVVAQGIQVTSCGAGSGVISTPGAHQGKYRCVGGGTANTVSTTAEDYFQHIFPVNEPYVIDGSYVKLRELRLNFELPAHWARRMNASAVNLGIIGRNLMTWTDVPNIDPEFSYSTGNMQGIEYAIIPNPRAIGFSVRVTP